MSHVATRDGRRLFVDEIGTGPPMLLVHGFTGSAEAWPREVRSGLARRFRVLCVDLLGHGRSDGPRTPARYALAEMVEDLCDLLDARGVARATWVGYSMGGRVALGTAVRRPGRVERLILESASPGLAEPRERRARRATDEALARMLEEQGIVRFVDHWMQLPLFRSQARLPAERRDAERRRRLACAPHALAACLRGLGTGVQPSLWGQLPRVRIPTRLIVGEHDPKLRALAARMQRLLPRADTRTLAGAGHATHLERPAAFVESVLDFCERTREARGGAKDEEGTVDARA